MSKVKTPPPWRSRIVSHGDAAPAELLPNPRNWRTHPSDQQAALSGALAEVGWVAEVTVNQVTGHVVDGHLRIELALARKEPTVPVTYVELSEDEERLVLASLDPLAAMAEAEATKLAELLEGLDPGDAALRAPLDELARDNDLDALRRGLVDPDDVPEVPEPAESYVQPGDLWALGDHRLLCGDATRPEDVARLMSGAEAECLWTDPPYGVEYVGKTRDHLTIENDDPAGSDAVIRGAFAAAPLAPSARFYIAAPAGPRHVAFHAAVISVGWRLHQELVWAKGSIVLGHSDYHYAHEPILYGYVPGGGRPGRGQHEGTRWYGDNAQSSLLAYPKPAANRDHPNAKPVGLVAQCLLNSTRPGDLVYEPFAGSGSTIVAAEQLGRHCYALEIEPRYAQVVIERWQRFTGREAVKLNA